MGYFQRSLAKTNDREAMTGQEAITGQHDCIHCQQLD